MLLDMAAEGFGDRVVLGPRDSGLTAAELGRRATAGAETLRSAGATAVLHVGPNSTLLPVAMFAAARARVPFVPLNYRLSTVQLGQLVDRHPGALALTVGDLATGVAAELGARQMSLISFAGDPDASAAPTEPPAEAAETSAAIIYTSGTTAAPKGVVVAHDNLVSYVFGTVDFASAAADDAALVSVPPYHIAAVANVVTNLYAGRRTVVLESFSADEWLRLVRSEEITSALVVPTMLARILDCGDDGDVPSLRSLAYGGARMPLPVIERALQRWPAVDFVNAYGLTETSSTIALLGPDDHRSAAGSEDPLIRRRLSSAGRPVPGVDIRIRNEDGAELPAGTPGRIHVRGAQVSGRYAESGSTLDLDGYFDTRDEGYLDADGYLFVSGRVDDTIIRGGENIAPAEIEDVLLAQDGVGEAVVVGLPDDEWGQKLAAAVVPRPGASIVPHELRSALLTQLRSSKTPELIHVCDDLPRNDAGKVVRRDVLRMLQLL